MSNNTPTDGQIMMAELAIRKIERAQQAEAISQEYRDSLAMNTSYTGIISTIHLAELLDTSHQTIMKTIEDNPDVLKGYVTYKSWDREEGSSYELGINQCMKLVPKLLEPSQTISLDFVRKLNRHTGHSKQTIEETPSYIYIKSEN